MSLYESVRRQIVPIHPEGYVFISAFAVGSLVLHWIWPPLGWIGALDSLYFDQSHFVRDCHTFLGMAPSEYAAMDHPILAAFMRERMKAHGSAVQTLDKPD